MNQMRNVSVSNHMGHTTLASTKDRNNHRLNFASSDSLHDHSVDAKGEQDIKTTNNEGKVWAKNIRKSINHNNKKSDFVHVEIF